MQKTKLIAAALSSVFALPALAETPVPTLSAVLDASGISLNGDIDYSYNSLSGTGKFTSAGLPASQTNANTTPGNNRVFDYAHNAFTLQAIDLTVAKQPTEGFGGLVDITLGKDASTIASFGTLTSASQTYDLTQAYVQYATGGMTAIGGKFATLAGQEVIKTSGNTNFSRSILFGYAIPFTHTGVRATYKFSDAFSLIGGVNNGWDQATDTNSNKTVELGVALAPAKVFSLTAQDYYGVEQVAGAPGGLQGKRNLLDVVATITATDSLNFVLNYDNGSQENGVANGISAKWNGWAAYANYQFNDQWRVSARGEIFNDKNGYRTGIVQKWKEATLTLAYLPNKSAELRGEIRKDTSDKAAFAYNDTIARKSQSSVGLEAIYKF